MYTGLELVQTTKGKPIGCFDAARIQADIDSQGANSEMGIAKLDLDSWIASCQINTEAQTPTNCNNLGMALKWLAIWRYRRFDMEHMKKKCDCTEDDYRALHYAQKRYASIWER